MPRKKVTAVGTRAAGTKAQRSAAETLAFARQVFETAPIGLVAYDAAGQCVAANEAAAAAGGATVEQLLSQNFRQIESWKRSGLLAAAEETLAGGGGRRVDVYLTTSFGREVRLDVRMEAFGAKGDRHLLLAVTDCSEQNKGEDRAHRDGQRKYRELFENSRVGMYRTKIDGSAILELNNALCELLGSPREKLLNRSSLISWADPGARAEVLRLLKANGSITDYEVEILRDDGEHLHCLISMQLHPEEGFIEGSIVDVTARKRAEEELAASEERYRTLFENAAVGMYRSRLDGSGIVALNQRLADIFGHTKEEMLNSPATIRWADPKARDEMVRLVRERGELRDHEIDIVTKGGQIRTTLASIKLFPGEGYLEGTAVDITERKRAEGALERFAREQAVRNDIAQIFLTLPGDEMYFEVLQVVLKAMESPFGVFGYLDEEGALVVPTMTRHIWDQCESVGSNGLPREPTRE